MTAEMLEILAKVAELQDATEARRAALIRERIFSREAWSSVNIEYRYGPVLRLDSWFRGGASLRTRQRAARKLVDDGFLEHTGRGQRLSTVKINTTGRQALEAR